ncbi:MAG: sigma-70 family RNA polymerase sigma factor, partial [Flavisolibacter sp.]|nr:sigma-70 family RNA polymerase sigma factor [Flavisolibacter sp.]
FKNERPGNEVIDENTQPVLRNLVDEQTEKKIFSKELARVLENCLQHLPVDYRTVFVLREMEGFNVAETAALLNITPVNVRVRLNRAKAMLQKHLERFYSSIDLYDFNDAHCDNIVRGVYTMIYEQISPVC